MVEQSLQWEVTQTVDTIIPGNPRYNEKARLAKTVQTRRPDVGRSGDVDRTLAHADEHMTCTPATRRGTELLRLPPAAEGQPEACRCCTTRAT